MYSKTIKLDSETSIVTLQAVYTHGGALDPSRRVETRYAQQHTDRKYAEVDEAHAQKEWSNGMEVQ